MLNLRLRVTWVYLACICIMWSRIPRFSTCSMWFWSLTMTLYIIVIILFLLHSSPAGGYPSCILWSHLLHFYIYLYCLIILSTPCIVFNTLILYSRQKIRIYLVSILVAIKMVVSLKTEVPVTKKVCNPRKQNKSIL